MKPLRTLALMALLGGWTGPAAAGELDDLVRQVQQSQAREAQADQDRKARFLADKNQQQKLLKDTQAALAQAEAEGKALREAFAANEARIKAMGLELKTKGGELNQLFGTVREFSGKFKSDLAESLISAQYPGRAAALEPLVLGKEIPGLTQLEGLWLGVLQEMNESGKVVAYTGLFTDAAGGERTGTIRRIGPFTAVAGGKYLRYVPDYGKLVEPQRQPERDSLALATNLEHADGGPVLAAVDPSRGVLLDLAAQVPQGLGWLPKSLRGLLNNEVDLVIFGVLLLASVWALAVAVERWLFFKRVDVAAYPKASVLQTELTRHMTVIGTVAANAPYVGLLGTVLGIMMTFHRMGTEKSSMDVHSIMLGLSTALKATAIGLLVAIPCVVLNNALRRRIRELMAAHEVRHG
ncbi:biopolymer transport protein ExbB [Methylomagnum ishizawai]|uniref:Biopolymer transport protein ExbB n=1 Tax=Methylomagnum ishizawai TaxID=1760988 RepID=A0A1Y6D3A5_9GAMM|nr:TonB-system energizer ExbB [Methylomagnum ishizawai]SMF97081.1 biopolymer transport protein ExbB [Methylomagnum ishizawai]